MTYHIAYHMRYMTPPNIPHNIHDISHNIPYNIHDTT